MVHPWHDIEQHEPVDAQFAAFIEIPKGSKLKYELDKETGLLAVDRVLFSAPSKGTRTCRSNLER